MNKQKWHNTTNGKIYEMTDTNNYPSVSNLNRGPCGIARNIWGFEPFSTGLQFLTGNTCHSDIEDCAHCPLNQNRKDV